MCLVTGIIFLFFLVPTGSPPGGGDCLCQRYKPTELAHPFLLCSFVYICLCGPFNCVSFPKLSWLLSVFSLSSSGLTFACLVSRSGELQTQKLKSHLVRTQSINVLPVKPGVGQYIAILATLTARAFFLAYFYPSGPFTCIFSKTSSNFILCWLWLTPVPV